MQLKNKCCKESISTLHNGHKSSDQDEIKMAFKRAFVGMIFQAIFHKNSLTLSLRFNFQMDFQKEHESGEAGIEALDAIIER